MTTRVTFMLVLTIVLSCVTARAQGARVGGMGGARGDVFVMGGPGAPQVIGGALNLIAVEPFETGPTVTGAPYSAEAVTEIAQLLHDGNRIENRTSVTIARDSEGRVRREQRAVAVGALVAQAPGPIITITDPSSGVFTTLDPERRVAIRSLRPSNRPLQTFTGVRDAARLGGAPPPLRPPPLQGQLVPPSDVRTESLGMTDIEGVHAEGTRVTVTIPAGAIGNQLPIAVVTERWYSPELQVVVQTRRADPRTGETVYRLTNIVRAEPPPNLFQIPADYRIEEPKPVIRTP
jgi:hypothetical protein